MGEEQEQEQVKTVEDSKDSSIEVERAKTEETQENKMDIADSVVRPSWFIPFLYKRLSASQQGTDNTIMHEVGVGEYTGKGEGQPEERRERIEA